MSSGSVSGFGLESKAISGTAFCAVAGIAARSVTASSSGTKYLIKNLLSCARCLGGGRWLQHEFLHSPGFDFPDDELVWIAAIHHVDDLEPAEFLARMAELTDDGPVQFQLGNLSSDVPRPRRIAIRVGVGCENVLMRALRNANRPTDAQVVVDLLRLEIVVEDLIPDVGAVGYPDIALPVVLKPVRQVELAGFFTGFLVARLRQEPAVLVELHYAVIAVSIGDENVALRIPGHVRRTTENVFLCGRVWTRRRRDGAQDRRRPAAEHHKEFAFRAELRDSVRAFVHRPDVVLRIDADGMREFKAVITLADFLDEVAIRI